ncbi:MAG: hypothetical protein V1696_02460 [Candidatus Jorgensenbacteria bacterium]
MKPPRLFGNLGHGEREYFLSFARTHEREIALHENPGGLWEKDVNGNDWSNVTEHCLIEAARVDMLARLLGFSDRIREYLTSAAAVHDFNKKEDIRRTHEDIAAGGSGRKGNLITEEESEKILRAAGFSDIVVSLAGCVSGDPKDVYRMKNILDLADPSPEDIAHLVMHYVDNYTRGSMWAEPSEKRGGQALNDIDRRNEMNTSNSAYKKIDREGLVLNEGHPFFDGMTRFEAAAALSHLIEKRLSGIMRVRGIDVRDPLDIPEFVDARIKENISKK